MFANRTVKFRSLQIKGECRDGARWRLFGANRKVVEYPQTVTEHPRIQEESGLEDFLR